MSPITVDPVVSLQLRQDAEQELADVWLRSQDRGRITRAAIDRRLLTNPEMEGESRPNNRRIMFETPLAVIFRIITQQSLVQVIHVWEY